MAVKRADGGVVYPASLLSFHFFINPLCPGHAVLSRMSYFFVPAILHMLFSQPPTPFRLAKSYSSSRFQLSCDLLQEAFLRPSHLN